MGYNKGILMEIEYWQAILATVGMCFSYFWGKYLTKKEIIEGVIINTIESLADNQFVMVEEREDGEKYLVSISDWVTTLEKAK